ncbi:hypothetical protein D1872_111790 [compost metagenome]
MQGGDYVMTSSGKNPTAGIGDPYWYEWTVGQNYVVDMLNTDNGIESVTLQATEAQGLDDVVIIYSDGTSEYVQVKHTRAEDTITFGNMLTLLKSMASAWSAQKSKWKKCTPVLFSNRVISTSYITVKNSDGIEYQRPPLGKFYTYLKSELIKAKKITDVQMPEEWSVAWGEWYGQLNELSNDEEKIEFLKLLVIKAEQPDLDNLTNQVAEKIAIAFGISNEKARSVLSQLDHALRQWATTFRGNKESINREDVYEVLSMHSEELVGDHMLMPPAPFFPSRLQFLEKLANHLLESTHPVTFLTGLPGQGKTSVVSALANRRNPVIDLRYHAFKPITPQMNRLPADAGVTTKAEVLWGDLLIELRSFFFKGRLAKYNVPIRNDFLTLEQLISEVLRLANILGEERGRPTVIAIDGIDHAARAGVDRHSFLDTLIPPDAVPKNVRFLIVGQPAESYDQYPHWLKVNSNKVAHWSLEGIQEEDISELLVTEIPNFPVDEFQATVRLINDVAKKNTLSAIFAFEEAKTVSSLEELQSKLVNRSLASGVSEYYERIWTAAVARLNERYPFVGLRLACCLSMTSERVTGRDLAMIFADMMDISFIDWTEALRSLRPLVIEENDGFRVIHNDVRVHLTKQVHAQPERLREVTSLIANYYWEVPDKGIARHSSLFDLLRKSDRHSDQTRVFTPEYVMEGIALERPMRELYDQCQQALLYAVETKDWNCIHTVSCAARTLAQLRKSVDWSGNSVDYVPEVPPLLFSEGRVPNQESWTIHGVYETMVDAYRLIGANEQERAFSLMKRWFDGMTPVDLLSILKNAVLDQISECEHLNETFKETLRVWGQVSYHVGLLWTEAKKTCISKDELNSEAWANWSNGMMREALKYGGVRDWIWCREVSTYTYFSDIEDILMQLASKRRWVEIACTLKEWEGKRDSLPKTLQIKAATLSLFTGNNNLINYWVQPIADEGFGWLEEIDSSLHLEDHALLYSMVSFILGWTKPARENSGIGEEGVLTYLENRRSHSKRGHLSALLHASALAGKWLGVYKRRGAEAAGRIVSSYEVKQVLEVLVSKKRNFNETVYRDQPVTQWIVEILLECATLTRGEVEKTVYQFVRKYSESYPVNYMMEIAWRYLWDRGEEELLERWFLHWCDEEGSVWGLEVSERINIVNRISDLAEETGFKEEAQRSRQLLKWGIIGYTGHKEYILESLQNWYKELARLDSGIWKNEGKRLLEICQVASELGDNRLAIFIEADVSASVAYEGPVDMWRLLNARNLNEPLLENVNMMIDGLISVLETIELSEKDLLTIWSFGIGVLNWHNEHDRCYLQDLKTALCYAAERNNITSIGDKLNDLGSAEFQLQGSRDSYHIPERWYEAHKTRMLSTDKSKNEFYQTLQELSIEKAIKLLKKKSEESLDNLETLCAGIHLIANRLKVEKPAGFPNHLQSLVKILSERDYMSYQWSHYSVRLAYQALVPLVRDSLRFELLEKVIANIDFDTEDQFWLESAAENLDDFCRFRALAVVGEDLKEGLQRLLKLHEMWIQGNGYLPEMVRIELADVQQLDSVPGTWSEFAVYYFFEILQSNNLTRIGLALRGLWALAQIVPTDLKYISDNWSNLSSSAQERVLLLVERAAISAPLAYEPFSEVVMTCYEGVDLGLKLQAWIILKAVERRTGEACPKWQLPVSPEQETFSSINSSIKGILDVPSIPRGLAFELHGIDIVRSLLHRFEAATMEGMEDIERKYASYLHKNPQFEENVKKIAIKRGQMGVRNLPQRSRLLKVIYHELSRGRWGNVPLTALAQALLKSDEPFILLNSPSPAVDAEEWTIDHDLDQLSGNKISLKESLLPSIQAGLSDDEVVLGAVLHTYSSSTDVEVIVDTNISVKGFELQEARDVTTMNGRTFALHSGDRFDPQNPMNPVLRMTYAVGGIGEFINQGMLCYPSLFWTNVLNWSPCVDNPLVWHEEEIPIVRFECFSGPHRKYSRDQLHRQPFLQRWVCSRETLKKIQSKFDVLLVQSTSINVRKIES